MLLLISAFDFDDSIDNCLINWRHAPSMLNIWEKNVHILEEVENDAEVVSVFTWKAKSDLPNHYELSSMHVKWYYKIWYLWNTFLQF